MSRVGVTFAIDLGQNWMAGPYGLYNRAHTKGNDYDAHGWEFGIQMSSPEFAGFKVLALVSYGEENYTNPNSLTGFTTKRLDRPLGTTLTVTFKQIEKWLGYAPTVSVGFLRHSSNISEFSYSRWTPQLDSAGTFVLARRRWTYSRRG
jgi:hypothetical protein